MSKVYGKCKDLKEYRQQLWWKGTAAAFLDDQLNGGRDGLVEVLNRLTHRVCELENSLGLNQSAKRTKVDVSIDENKQLSFNEPGEKYPHDLDEKRLDEEELGDIQEIEKTLDEEAKTKTTKRVLL